MALKCYWKWFWCYNDSRERDFGDNEVLFVMIVISGKTPIKWKANEASLDLLKIIAHELDKTGSNYSSIERVDDSYDSMQSYETSVPKLNWKVNEAAIDLLKIIAHELDSDSSIYSKIEAADDSYISRLSWETSVEKLNWKANEASMKILGICVTRSYLYYAPKEQDSGGQKPAVDPAKEYGVDGTPIGKGASAVAAEKAITSLPNDKDPAGSAFAPLMLKSTKQTKTSIKLSWKNVSGAKTYIVYGNVCGNTKKLRKLAVTSGKTFTVKKINKTLKKGTYHKFVVMALDSSNHVVSTSKIIHVATKGKANYSKVTSKAKNNKVSLKKGKTFKLSAKAVGKSVKKHVGVRYETSNPKIATVSKSGTIKGVKKGKCKVYVYAQNGICITISVTVK